MQKVTSAIEVLCRFSAECLFFCLQEHVKSIRTFHVNHDKIEHPEEKNKKNLGALPPSRPLHTCPFILFYRPQNGSGRGAKHQGRAAIKGWGSCNPAHISLAGQFAVEARQADGKGLEGAHGVVVVQGEDVLSHTTKLHDYVVGCREGGETTSVQLNRRRR